MIQPISPSDIFLFPSGEWLFRYQIPEEIDEEKEEFSIIPYLSLNWYHFVHETDVKASPCNSSS